MGIITGLLMGLECYGCSWTFLGWMEMNHIISHKKRWLVFALIAFFLHMTGLLWMQWRALFVHFPDTTGLLLSFRYWKVCKKPVVFTHAFLSSLYGAAH